MRRPWLLVAVSVAAVAGVFAVVVTAGLFETQGTVETHLMHISQELDIHTRAALATDLFGNA